MKRDNMPTERSRVGRRTQRNIIIIMFTRYGLARARRTI